MAVTSKLYTKFFVSMANKEVDLNSDNIKVMLLASYSSASTPSVAGGQDMAQYLSDVLAVSAEATGTGYTAGGKTVGTVTVSTNGSSFLAVMPDVTWANSTISAAYAVFYNGTPSTDATRPVIGFWDFGGTLSTTNGPFSLQQPSTGWMTLTRA